MAGPKKNCSSNIELIQPSSPISYFRIFTEKKPGRNVGLEKKMDGFNWNGEIVGGENKKLKSNKGTKISSLPLLYSFPSSPRIPKITNFHSGSWLHKSFKEASEKRSKQGSPFDKGWRWTKSVERNYKERKRQREWVWTVSRKTVSEDWREGKEKVYRKGDRFPLPPFISLLYPLFIHPRSTQRLMQPHT